MVIVWIFAVLLILYLVLLLLLRCRKGNETWAKLKPQRYAHRGYHDKPTIPENSMPAFRRAIEHGWGAELDVHLLRDGTLAVFHDSDLKRCANVEGQIEDLDLEGLRKLRLEGTDEQVPLFDDVLALFEGKQPLIIELKTAKGNHRALAEAVCRRLDSYTGRFLHRVVRPVRGCGRAEAAARHLPRAAEHELFEGAVGIAVVSAVFDDERPAELVHATGFSRLSVL